MAEIYYWINEAVNTTALTQKQAKVYFLREQGFDREEVADIMGTSASNIDNLYGVAQRKLDEAKNLIRLDEAL